MRPPSPSAIEPAGGPGSPASPGRLDAAYEDVDRSVAGGRRLAVAEGGLQRIVGENLRAYRQARGLSQEAFADVLKFHRTYVGDLERGERNLTLKAVERIAARLGLEPMALLGAVKARKGGE